MRHLASVVSASLLMIVVPGCIVVGGNSVEESGVRVSASTFDQVTIGETTAAWILATLGEPSERTCVDPAATPRIEVFRYDHTLTKASGTVVCLLFAGGSSETQRRTAFFECTDGVVSRYWIEQ